MKVLIFHGYLLRGTGSNVYNAELARAFARAGDEVHLLAQDRDPLALDWVDAAGDWDEGALAVRERGRPVRATVYRPDIGGLLPVYVPDRYDGIEARAFSELTEEELEAYLAANVAAVREVVARAAPDVALANHLVMGPAILARALAGTGVPYAVKIHGSALEYTVKPHPRFLPYAKEGLAGAGGILTGSRHTAESLWAALEDPALPARTRLGPPGVDVEGFAPREPAAAHDGVRALIGRLEASRAAAGDESAFARDPAEAAAALRTVELGEDRVVVYVGKLIGSKGVELLLAAWPLVLAAEPRARLVVVGFGAMRPGLERLAAALGAGDFAGARMARAEDGRELPHLTSFLDGLEPGDREAYARTADGLSGPGGRVAWAGRLEHAELTDLLPAAEATVMPSTFPEAFGMVAAEAAACGSFPVVARHSGLAEVAEALGGAVGPEVAPLLSFDVSPRAVQDLAGCLTGWLAAPPEARAATREAIVATTRERYSWAGVARTVVAAARGELASLPTP